MSHSTPSFASPQNTGAGGCPPSDWIPFLCLQVLQLETIISALVVIAPRERRAAGSRHTEGMFPSQSLLWSLGPGPEWLQTPLVAGSPAKDLCPLLLFLAWTLPPCLSALHPVLSQFLGLLQTPARWQLCWVVTHFLESELRVRPSAGERLCYASCPITVLLEGAEARLESNGVAWVLRQRVLQLICPPARQLLQDSVWPHGPRPGKGVPCQSCTPSAHLSMLLPEC